MKLERGGLSIIEASFLLAAVVAGTLMMQIYLKRAIQGRLRAVSDGLSETQYSPGRTISGVQTVISDTSEESSGGGISLTTSIETRSRSGEETINRE